MKVQNWKKKTVSLVGLSLMVLALGSCGSDNKVAVTPAPDTSGTNESTATATSETSSCQTTSSFSEFKERVSNGAFIQPSANRSVYYYNSADKNSWNIWIIKYNDFTRSYNGDLNYVQHEKGNTVDAVKNFLVTKLNEAKDTSGGGRSYTIETTSGEIYTIDLCKPIVANPTFWESSDGEERYQLAN